MCCIPALLTRISTPPNYLVACSIRFLESDGLVKSAKMNLALTLLAVICDVTFLIYYSEANPFKTMLAPAADNCLAIPRPIPLSDPVTTAVLPTKNLVKTI